MAFSFNFFAENNRNSFDGFSANVCKDANAESCQLNRLSRDVAQPSSFSYSLDPETGIRLRDLFDIQMQVVSAESLCCDFINQNSDLIPSLYEGGFKVWECTRDLIRFISSRPDLCGFLRQKTILDLGCGSGLVGIYAHVSCGAALVDFHDFNQSVLEFYTLPNWIMNFEVATQSSSCAEKNEFEVSLDAFQKAFDYANFIYGDWDDFCCASYEQKYDAIFTCETIYSPQSYPKIANVLRKYLKNIADKGVCYLAAKKYYFGCGGSPYEFILYLNATFPGEFDSECVFTSEDGVSRQIWAIYRLWVIFKAALKPV